MTKVRIELTLTTSKPSSGNNILGVLCSYVKRLPGVLRIDHSTVIIEETIPASSASSRSLSQSEALAKAPQDF